MSWLVVDTIEPWTGSRLVTDDEYYSLLLQGVIYSAVPQEDAVVPGSLLPATDGQVGALSDKIDNFISIQLNVKDFGAKGDGVHDDSAAIQAAITATQAGSQKGGRLTLPAGIYNCGTFLDFRGAENVIFEGVGGRTAGMAAATIIRYTGADAANFIDMRSTIGCGIRDMQILHTNNFTGRMIDFRNALGGGLLALGVAYAFVSNCYIGGSVTYPTSIGVDLDNSTRVALLDCAFYYVSICVHGRSVANQANVVSIERCGFNKYATVAIRNPGQAWSIRDCTFEGTTAASNASMDHDSGVYAEGLTVQGCWTGDATGGVQFVVSGYGINFMGNWVGATSGDGIHVDEFAVGFNVIGNRFYSNTTSITVATSATNKKHYIYGNAYDAVTTRYSGTTVTGLYGDDAAGTVALPGAATVAGTLTLIDGANLPVGTSTGSQIATATTQKLGFWGTTPNVRPVLAYSRSADIQTNVLLNGSFDSNLTSWVTASSAYTNTLNGSLTRITTDQSPSDNSSAACADVVYTSATNQQGIKQTVAGNAALTVFYASAWIKNLSGRPVVLRMRDTTNSGSIVNSATVAVGAGWTLVTAQITTGASPASVDVAICTDSTTANGEFYVDDIRLGSVVTVESSQLARLRRVLASTGLITDSTVA